MKTAKGNSERATPDSEPPVLFTSIPPVTRRWRSGVEVGAAYQRQCVESWLAAGFRVVSVNPSNEADQIRSLGLPIDVQSVQYDGPPRIASVLDLARSSGAPLCGIVNADCMIVNGSWLSSELAEATTGGIYLLERIDVSEYGEAHPGNCAGFDLFVFAPSQIDADFDRRLRIGDPWWDYWFPCLLSLRGVEVYRIVTPVLAHLLHEAGWNAERWHANGEYFRDQMVLAMPEAKGEELVSSLERMNIKKAPIEHVAQEVHEWLRGRPQSFSSKSGRDSVFNEVNLLRSLREYHSVDAPVAIKRCKQDIQRLERARRKDLDLVEKACGYATLGIQDVTSNSIFPWSSLARAVGRLGGTSQRGVQSLVLLVEWAGSVKLRGYITATTLVLIIICLIAAPFIISDLYGTRYLWWGAAMSIWGVLVAVLSYSLARHGLRRRVKLAHTLRTLRDRFMIN